ncbi:MAG: hypothetical protein WD572_05425 [Gammaproteobacteria bacterium]
MDRSQLNIGNMVKTTRHLNGVPPDTFGVVCEMNDEHTLVAWNLCDKPLPNLTPNSIAELDDDDPQCPLRDRLRSDNELEKIEPA